MSIEGVCLIEREPGQVVSITMKPTPLLDCSCFTNNHVRFEFLLQISHTIFNYRRAVEYNPQKQIYNDNICNWEIYIANRHIANK